MLEYLSYKEQQTVQLPTAKDILDLREELEEKLRWELEAKYKSMVVLKDNSFEFAMTSFESCDSPFKRIGYWFKLNGREHVGEVKASQDVDTLEELNEYAEQLTKEVLESVAIAILGSVGASEKMMKSVRELAHEVWIRRKGWRNGWEARS